MDKLISDRDEANRRLHWHLSQAVAMAAGCLYLGPRFDQIMLEVERARADWNTAQTAMFNWKPPTP